MMNFFGQDFAAERWKKAALKNAFALLSKQRFEHAAAFFLLGGKLWDACEVCISRLGDLQLALVIARLHDSDGGPVYEKILKKAILGIGDVSTPAGGTEEIRGEPNPDCFVRSIACWLLQDYSTALETLLLSDHTTGSSGTTETARYLSKSPDPSIFNFYFFLRSHPLLIRRNQHDYRSLGAKSHSLLPPVSPHESSCTGKHPLSSVGGEPFTALERNLLFSTAYHHLNHGCPVLALDVLSKLPKSSSLGADLNSTTEHRTDPNRDGLHEGRAEGVTRKKAKLVEPTASLTGMIQSGTLRGFDFSCKSLAGTADSITEEEDWSQPVSSSQTPGPHPGEDDLDRSLPVSQQKGQHEEEEEIDWSKPITSSYMLSPSEGRGRPGMGGDNENDFDWSKPVSRHFGIDDKSPSLSPPNFSSGGLNPFSPPLSDGVQLDGSNDSSPPPSSQTTLSSQGLFVLSLAEQLQYNACLSILTEELITIYLPPCCDYLWEQGGKESLPLLPLAKQHGEKHLALHYQESAFEKTVLHLRGMLVVWLRREMSIVKEICGLDNSREDLEESSEEYVPAGYDLLTTLMNYASLHAGTTPSLITVKLELMHLMNTLLPWSTQPTAAEQDSERDNTLSSSPSDVPTCAVDPSQLPILTSCSLPAKHLTNLSLHLRLMSASVIEVLANHTCPPILSKPLPHVHKVFELCCAISNSITVCLSPINITDIAPDLLSPPSLGSHTVTVSGVATPIVPGGADVSQSFEARQRAHSSPKTPQRTTKSGGLSQLHFISDLLGPPVSPNTKPSKWPGVAKWPKSLQSDEGKDPTPMSLILAECCIAVYVGLVSIAWSWHSITDLLLLIRNCPSQQFWDLAFGGGLDMKQNEERGRKGGGGRGGGGGEKSAFMRKVDSMKKGIKMLRKSPSQTGESIGLGLFVAPQKTLLDLFLGGTVSDPRTIYCNYTQFAEIKAC